MNVNITQSSDDESPLHILLADDDVDDRYFFGRVLKGLSIPTELTTVNDGESLMIWLSDNTENLPQILFLDLNMPRKNGMECLLEIKQDEMLRHLPVIIYSTHKHEKEDHILYQNGAHYYIRKTDIIELAKILHRILTVMKEDKFVRPAKEDFIFSFVD